MLLFLAVIVCFGYFWSLVLETFLQQILDCKISLYVHWNRRGKSKYRYVNIAFPTINFSNKSPCSIMSIVKIVSLERVTVIMAEMSWEMRNMAAMNISRVNIRALVVWNDLWYSFFSHPYFYFGESRDKWIFEKSSLRRWVIWRFMRKFKKKLGQRWNSKGSLGYILEEYWGIYPWSYSWRSSGVQNIMFDTTLNLQD